jgi:hypothetical protein
MKISQAGIQFLKCAFASPDFDNDPGEGIPDRFEGKTLMRKDQLTSAQTFTPNKTTWILVLPTPGKALWSCVTNLGVVPSATDEFTAVDFPGALELFPNTSTSNFAKNVTEFRYASMAFGIYPTSNMMQYGGAISVWKAPIKWSSTDIARTINTDPPQVVDVTQATINGLTSVHKISRDNFSTGFNNGMYAVSTAEDEDFPFWPIRAGYGISMPPSHTTPAEADMPFRLAAGSGQCGIVGCDGMQSIIIRVDTPENAVNAAVLKSWACVEYKVTSDTIFEQFARVSAPYDPVALLQYRKIANELPVAVRACDNATMWERVKQFLAISLQVASYVPGPVGQVAGHVQGLAELLANLGM